LKTLLLHTCCAPCICHVYEILSDEYDISAYYYNPNIAPEKEYTARLDELKRFADAKGFTVICGTFKNMEWTEKISELSLLGEKSERCWMCYRIRMEETFKMAVDLEFDVVATALSISPHKNASVINSIGRELEAKYDVEFLEADFKKKDGFKKSVMLSKKYAFYRQDYCGCIYSKMERDRDSEWSRKVREYRMRISTAQ